MNIEEIIKEAEEFGMVQNSYEITEAAKFFKNLNVKNFIEIGTDQGGTFLVWSKLSDPNGLKISVDWAYGPWSKNTYDVVKRNEKMLSFGDNVFILEGNSHSENMIHTVNQILNGEKVDFLFIDGDHSYLGVKLDYYMYKQFVKPGGWIGFHDIKNTDFHHQVNCFVDQFWEEIKEPKNWFFSNSDWGGIGFVQMN